MKTPNPTPRLVPDRPSDEFPEPSAAAMQQARDDLDALAEMGPPDDAAPAAPAEGYTQQVYALARRLLWIAYVWNDHNFEAAHIEARREAQRFGIESFASANEWLEREAEIAAPRVTGGREVVLCGACDGSGVLPHNGSECPFCDAALQAANGGENCND